MIYIEFRTNFVVRLNWFFAFAVPQNIVLISDFGWIVNDSIP